MQKCLSGLMNEWVKFQRAMDLAFIGEIDEIFDVYLDELTFFSTSNLEHLRNLHQTFQKCIRFGVFLNTKKLRFATKEGKFLGRFVSRGVKIDPIRVEATNIIDLSRKEK